MESVDEEGAVKGMAGRKGTTKRTISGRLDAAPAGSSPLRIACTCASCRRFHRHDSDARKTSNWRKLTGVDIRATASSKACTAPCILHKLAS